MVRTDPTHSSTLVTIFNLLPFEGFSMSARYSNPRRAIVAILLAVASFKSPAADAPALMHAKTWDGEADIAGWWMSEKMDGVRAYWTGSTLLTRLGNPIPAPPWFVKELPPMPLDGELWIDRGRFSRVMSIVRTATPDNRWREIQYVIFDLPHDYEDFEARIRRGREWFARNPSAFVRIIEHDVCRDAAHVRERLDKIEAHGGEGLMLCNPRSTYVRKRSSDLLKVKSFEDAEAVVIGHQPGTGKHEGRMGSIRVRLPSGIEFAIGTGFSDVERDSPPPAGAVITFKYYGYTAAGIPRFASFLRVREEW